MTQIFINNAGLAIIHPYLPMLFDRLELLDAEKQFKDEDSILRGVYLLQYLATGSDITEETFLAFNKLLCGWPIEKPISKVIKLSDEDKQMCDSMLEAVIQNWNALGDTSIPALQGSFLIREGMLFQKDGNWQLKVEQKAFDVLLTQLPWSITQINEPWIEQKILVDWK